MMCQNKKRKNDVELLAEPVLQRHLQGVEKSR